MQFYIFYFIFPFYIHCRAHFIIFLLKIDSYVKMTNLFVSYCIFLSYFAMSQKHFWNFFFFLLSLNIIFLSSFVWTAAAACNHYIVLIRFLQFPASLYLVNSTENTFYKLCFNFSSSFFRKRRLNLISISSLSRYPTVPLSLLMNRKRKKQTSEWEGARSLTKKSSGIEQQCDSLSIEVISK